MTVCLYCMHINYPIVTSGAQETAAHPDASQVEAQKQLEEERLDVRCHTLDVYTVNNYSYHYNSSGVHYV